MSVTLTIFYMDDKEINIEISEDELDRFSEHISSHKIYWDKDVIKGFWTDISKVRYINFLRHNAEGCYEQRESVPENSTKVSSET